jgi:hypothetical protein
MLPFFILNLGIIKINTNYDRTGNYLKRHPKCESDR